LQVLVCVACGGPSITICDVEKMLI